MGVVVAFGTCEVNGKPGYRGVMESGAETECFTYDPDSIASRAGAIAEVQRAHRALLEADQAQAPAERSIIPPPVAVP